MMGFSNKLERRKLLWGYCVQAVHAHLKQGGICIVTQLGFTAHEHLGNGQVAMTQGCCQGCAIPAVSYVHISIIPAPKG